MIDAVALKYRVLAPVTFHAGALLGLTEAQARARRHALKAARNGLHEVTGPVEFKAGEEIGYAGALPKGLAASVQALGGRGTAKTAA